jgi:hypothetical protein
MDALLTKKIQEFGTLRGSVNRYMFVDLTAVMSAFSNDEKEAIYSFDLDEIKNEYVIRSFNRFKTLLESYLDIETDINDYDTLNRVYVLLFNKRFEIIAESLLNYIYNNKALIESRTMKEIESNLTNVAEDILRDKEFLKQEAIDVNKLQNYISLTKYKNIVLDDFLLANDSYVDNILSLVNRKFDKDKYIEVLNNN